MPRSPVEIPKASFAKFRREMVKKMERVVLRASDRAIAQAKSETRKALSSAGAGRLSMAIGVDSDLKKGRGVHRRPDGFSASGAMYVRTGSERSRGTLEALTEGADIRPRRGGWLWIPSSAIPAYIGAGKSRRRMTPELYSKSGLVQRIGPLIAIDGRRPGERLLIVRNVSLRRDKPTGSARALPRRKLNSTREARETLVAFVGIKRTSRTRRVDPDAIMRRAAADLPRLIDDELRRS